MGWGDSYDQWVYATSILKDNEVNRALMKYRNNGETFGNCSLSIWEEIVVIPCMPSREIE